MKISEIYQEEPNSLFLHDGNYYDLNKLFILTADLDVKSFPIDKLKWILTTSDFNNISRINNANIETPILITKWYDKSVNKNRFVVLDGLHRLMNAIIKNRENILIKYVPNDILQQVMCA